jgi:hypothetical protein
MGQNVTRVSPLVTAHINVLANPSGTGNTAVVAAVAGARYRVLSVALVSTLANNVKFQSNTTDISATFPLGANGGFILPFNEHGWFQTAVGEALNVNLSVATATGVQVQYIMLMS